jgi:hypothetical protein
MQASWRRGPDGSSLVQRGIKPADWEERNWASRAFSRRERLALLARWSSSDFSRPRHRSRRGTLHPGFQVPTHPRPTSRAVPEARQVGPGPVGAIASAERAAHLIGALVRWNWEEDRRISGSIRLNKPSQHQLRDACGVCGVLPGEVASLDLPPAIILT